MNEEQIKKLVIARIDAQMPSNIKISIGSKCSLNKEEMKEHVRKGDAQGKQIMQMHMNFLKATASGHVLKELNTI